MNEENFQKLLVVLMKHGKDKFWNKIYSKWKKNNLPDSQSLLIHSYNQINLIKRFFLNYCMPSFFTEREIIECILGSFFSDIGKESPKYQNAVIEGKIEAELYDHITEAEILRIKEHLNIIKEDLMPILKDFNIDTSSLNWDDFVKSIISNVFFHQLNTARKLSELTAKYGSRTKSSNLIDYIDDLVSAKTVRQAYDNAKNIDSIQHLIYPIEFNYHKISRFRGILSVSLNEIMIKSFEENGYEPLLFFSEGVLYIRRKNNSDLQMNYEKVKHKLKEKIEEFIKRENLKANIYGLTFGLKNATLIKTGELLNDNIIKIKIENEVQISEGNLSENLRKIRKMKSLIQDKLIGELLDEKSREYNVPTDTFGENLVRFRNSSQYFYAIYLEFKKWIDSIQDNEEKKQVDNEFKNIIFNNYPSTFLENGKSGHSNSAKWDNIIPYLIDLMLEKDDNGKYLNNLSILTNVIQKNEIIKRMVRVLQELYNLVKKYQPKIIKNNILDELLLDLIEPKLVSMGNQLLIAQKLNQFYQLPKSNPQAQTCFFCGNSNVETAIAGLVGRGAEKFSNQLVGGKGLGGSNKAYICSICKLEALLRYLSLGNIPNESILIAPEMCISPDLKIEWGREIQLFIRAQDSGLPILNDKVLARIFEDIAIAGEPVMKSLDGKWLIERAILGGEKLLKYKRLLENEYNGNLNDFNMVFGTNYEKFEDAIDDIYHGRLWADSLKSIVPSSTQMNFFYETPNYILILAQYPIGSNDPDSQAYLRKMQIGLILSIIFNARIKFIDSLNPLLTKELNNLIEISKNPLSDQILKRLIGTNIVSLHNYTELLQKICIFTTLEQKIENPEKDFLLKYLKESRGRILNKFIQTMKMNISPNILNLLNQISDK